MPAHSVGTILRLVRDDELDGEVTREVTSIQNDLCKLNQPLLVGDGAALILEGAVAGGWSVVSAQEPLPELPNENGWYLGEGGRVVQRDFGAWRFANGAGMSHEDVIDRLPLTLLRPEPEVRAEVVEEIAAWLEDPYHAPGYAAALRRHFAPQEDA